MKLLIIIFIFFSTLVASDSVCYSVQLVSKYDTKENRLELKNNAYPNGCKAMKIGSYLTVRCGCTDSKDEAKGKLLSKLKKGYPQAIVMRTARYRFKKDDDFQTKNKKSNLKKKKISKNSSMCYTLQLVTKSDTPKNRDFFRNTTIPNGCLNMKVGRYLTLRCGCYDTKQEALKHKKRYSKKYPGLLAVRTARSRFQGNSFIEKKKKKVVKPKPKLKVKPKPKQKVQKRITKEELIEVLQPPIYPVKPLNTRTFDKKKNKNTKKNKKYKHKKKHKHKHNKKNKKFKYIKKKANRALHFNTLNGSFGILKSKRALGPFEYRYKFGGQISYDLLAANEANSNYEADNFRRVRVYHDGSIFKDLLFYEMKLSFVGKSKYKDFFIGHSSKIIPLKIKYLVKFGNIKIPFSMEGYSSSKYITFLERSLGDDFLIGRKFGGELFLSNKLGNFYTNLFFSSFSNSFDDKLANKVEKEGKSIRATFAYKFHKHHILSIGAGYLTQEYHGLKVKFSQPMESTLTRNKYVHVKIKHVSTINLANFELFYMYNKFAFQTEFLKVDVNALKDNYSFNSYYLEGSYFLVGDGKRFKLKTSTLANVKPSNKGAVEVAFRYSQIDLNNKDEHGGREINYTSGVNWYLSKNFKIAANYVVAMPKKTDDYDGLLQFFEIRTLFAF